MPAYGASTPSSHTEASALCACPFLPAAATLQAGRKVASLPPLNITEASPALFEGLLPSLNLSDPAALQARSHVLVSAQEHSA
jgi:hypothetical protein